MAPLLPLCSVLVAVVGCSSKSDSAPAVEPAPAHCERLSRGLAHAHWHNTDIMRDVALGMPERMWIKSKSAFRKAVLKECPRWNLTEDQVECTQRGGALRELRGCGFPRSDLLAPLWALSNYMTAHLALRNISEMLRNSPRKSPAIPPTPRRLSCRGVRADRATFGKHPLYDPWISHEDHLYVSLEVESRKKTFLIRASGDADCDGVLSTYELEVPRRRGRGYTPESVTVNNPME